MSQSESGKILVASAFLALLLASPAPATERIPGPALEPAASRAALSWCPANRCAESTAERWGDAIGFGLAALGAALLLRRPSWRKDPAAPSLDAT